MGASETSITGSWMSPSATTAGRIRTGHAAHNMAILKRIGHKRLPAAWNKDYLCRPIGLDPKPIWMQSSCGACRPCHMARHSMLHNHRVT